MKIIAILCVLWCSLLQANTDGNKQQSDKEIKEAINKGDFYYSKVEPFYNLAIESYSSVYDHYVNNASLNFKLGTCYLTSSEKEKAKQLLTKAYTLDKKVDPDILFNIAPAHHLLMEWDQAIE